jgi:hypothetical protein
MHFVSESEAIVEDHLPATQSMQPFTPFITFQDAWSWYLPATQSMQAVVSFDTPLLAGH